MGETCMRKLQKPLVGHGGWGGQGEGGHLMSKAAEGKWLKWWELGENGGGGLGGGGEKRRSNEGDQCFASAIVVALGMCIVPRLVCPHGLLFVQLSPTLPLLYAVVCRVLAVPATACDVERCFLSLKWVRDEQ